jgi:hypothetical protein
VRRNLVIAAICPLLMVSTALAGAVEVAFSPHAGATELVVKTIGQAR